MMKVRKRNGREVKMQFDKILSRIEKQTYNLDKRVDSHIIAQHVIRSLKDGITTTEIDDVIAKTCAEFVTKHPDYSKLGGRIAMSSWHKDRKIPFSQMVKELYDYHFDSELNNSLISDKLLNLSIKYEKEISEMMDFNRDFNLEYFGIKTLEHSYLIKKDNKAYELPQHLYMRVALAIWEDNLEMVEKVYDSLSLGIYTHATPTLYNAGTRRNQNSSCFLLAMPEDSINGIYTLLHQCANISQNSGGIGIHIHNIRGKGAKIKGTNGKSNGIVPMLRVFNDSARYVDQGGGKRPGSIAVYLEPWHSDIEDFLDLRKNHGKEETRTRDLFLALWTNDYFMECVKANSDWYLMTPDQSKGLSDVYGDEFKDLYLHYVRNNIFVKKVKAQDIWLKILESQIETGTPYMLYKDTANKRSNQKNIGTIKSSNLCTEIMEVSNKDEIAVCNLASIALPKFVIDGKFDFDRLMQVASELTYNLNRVIDSNYYPLPQAEYSNLRNRPIGIGVQGLADVFAILRMPFDSPEARELNKAIFEAIYYGALLASNELAIRDGAYETFKGSPASEGILQFDYVEGVTLKFKDKWEKLRPSIVKFGLRNSLLVAPMPTASTAQILGNNECFEPFSSNMYNRRVSSGEFTVINKHLVGELIARNLWNDDTIKRMIAGNGSIQNIPSIPNDLKEIYRTVWEIPQKSIIDMAADRQAFIDQSQSMNLFMANPTYKKLTAAHFYGWEKGLKTGMYYLRSTPSVDPLKSLAINDLVELNNEPNACSIDNPNCEACGA